MLTSVLLAFSKALRDAGIDPSKVEVSLPTPEWKALDGALAPETSDLFEGVSVGGRLNVGGVRYLGGDGSMMSDNPGAWREDALHGWAALHNIREALTRLSPPGSLDTEEEEEFTYGPEHVQEAALHAIHALHVRAVNAEQEVAEFRGFLETALPILHSASVPIREGPCGDLTEVLVPAEDIQLARELHAKVREYLEAPAPSPRT
jgi:hypothetical protein